MNNAVTDAMINDALASNAWPFKEAEKIKQRWEKNPSEKGFVLFETGYGPSGLPHIGTFAEVFRTTLVRRAFEYISNVPTKLYAFSDDMDGLRKVPDNLPNPDLIRANIGKPLTEIPDPFGTHNSFGAHMNNRLREFLDHYGFDYEFKSASQCYKSGIFDETLLKFLTHYDKVQSIMLPTLGEERRATYSPFMPLCPKTGHVLQVAIDAINIDNGTITYTDPNDGEKMETTVTGGNCKLQWKPDWGMRWAALGVDYEMHGKDLTPSAVLSQRIAKVVGNDAPINYVYEMFLDKEGTKISKSKGNGLSIEEWLKYGTPESLSTFLFSSPNKQKRLHFEIIPKSVDEYLSHWEKSASQEPTKLLANPVWHIHHGNIPAYNMPVSFGLLLNLASACNPESPDVLWGFINNYAPNVTKENCPLLGTLIDYAIVYYEDFVKPNKNYRAANEAEKSAIISLANQLKNLPKNSSADDIQTHVFSIGKEHGYENLRQWFQALYEILLGQSQGPRMGSFIALYGIEDTLTLIDRALNEELAH